MQIHQRIESEEKKAGLAGTYEFSKQLNLNQSNEDSSNIRVSDSREIHNDDHSERIVNRQAVRDSRKYN